MSILFNILSNNTISCLRVLFYGFYIFYLLLYSCFYLLFKFLTLIISLLNFLVCNSELVLLSSCCTLVKHPIVPQLLLASTCHSTLKPLYIFLIFFLFIHFLWFYFYFYFIFCFFYFLDNKRHMTAVTWCITYLYDIGLELGRRG